MMRARFRLLPMSNITGEGVKKFVDAEKALIGSMIKPRAAEHRANRAPRRGRRQHHMLQNVAASGMGERSRRRASTGWSRASVACLRGVRAR